MNELETLVNTLSPLVKEITELEKNASAIQKTYEALNTRYASIDEKISKAEALAEKLISAEKILKASVDKMDEAQPAINQNIDTSNKIYSILTSLAEVQEASLASIEPVVTKIQKNDTRLAKIYDQTANEHMELIKQVEKLSVNLQKIDTLKITNESLNSILQSLNDTDETLSKLDALKNAIEENTQVYTRLSNQFDEITNMTPKDDLLSDNVTAKKTKAAIVPKDKNVLNEKRNAKKNEGAWAKIQVQLDNHNISLDDDLIIAIKEYLNKAKVIINDGRESFIDRKSSLCITKDGRNNRKEWTADYYTNIQEIEVPDDLTEPLKLRGINIRGNVEIDNRIITIKYIGDFCLYNK